MLNQSQPALCLFPFPFELLKQRIFIYLFTNPLVFLFSLLSSLNLGFRSQCHDGNRPPFPPSPPIWFPFFCFLAGTREARISFVTALRLPLEFTGSILSTYLCQKLPEIPPCVFRFHSSYLSSSYWLNLVSLPPPPSPKRNFPNWSQFCFVLCKPLDRAPRRRLSFGVV